MNFQEPLSGLFERIARAIERLGPREPERPDFAAGDAFVWQAETQSLLTVRTVNRVPLALLKGIDAARDTLLANTARFARGLPANNALLWGARGMGKSSLVKAVHGEVAGAQTRRDPSRGHPVAAASACPSARGAGQALHSVLRRPLLRGARHLVQIAQSRARRRHRGKARQRAVLRDLEPQTSDAARDGRQRAVHRHQSRRSGRGEALAVRSFRAVDRLP